MVHFIRNIDNKTIIECEVNKNDLSAVVNIRNFVNTLNEQHKWVREDFTNDIADLSEIRGWWWESAEDSGDYSSIDEFVSEKFKSVVTKYNTDEDNLQLLYITD